MRLGSDLEGTVHGDNAPVVGVDQHVVEDQRSAHALIRQKPGECEAGQHGDLLARAIAQMIQRFLALAANETGGGILLAQSERG